MFEILATTSVSVASEAVYEAALRLFERARYRNGEFESPDGEQQRPAGGLRKDGVKVAQSILGEIQRREAKPLPQLSDQEVERYTAELVEILEQRIRSQPGYDEKKGRALLEDLRVSYQSSAGASFA